MMACESDFYSQVDDMIIQARSRPIWSSKPNLVRQRFAKPPVTHKGVQVRVLSAPPVPFAANVVGSEGMCGQRFIQGEM